MALIEKQIRKHANQKFAAPIVTVTELSLRDVIIAVKKIRNDHNAASDTEIAAKEANRGPRRFTVAPVPERSHYHLQFTKSAILVGWSRSPEWITAQVKKKSSSRQGGSWLASVTFPETVPDVPDGQRAVEIKLLRWMMDDHGRMQNKTRYEWFVDQLAEVLAAGVQQSQDARPS